MKLIFATNNKHKVDEIRHIVKKEFEILTMKEAGIDIDITEPHSTIQANASEKSRTIYQMTTTDCFSEDTGLEVAALNGEPGVKSARYAGEGRSADQNMDKLLDKLKNESNTNARFKTIISLIIGGEETLFEGLCEGRIIREKRGSQGFGYDPIFVPDGSEKTFGEMDLNEKDLFSHRAIATKKLTAFLNNLNRKTES